MRKRFVCNVALFATTLPMMLSSCASIVSGGSPKIFIDGDIKEPVTIITEKQMYTNVDLPYRVKVNRHHIDGQHIQIKSEKGRYKDIVLEKSTNGWVFGNILVGGLIGWGIDLITNCVSQPQQRHFYIQKSDLRTNDIEISYRPIENKPIEGSFTIKPVEQNVVWGAAPITVGNVTFYMVPVNGGTFKMGGTEEQGQDINADEKPVHSVTLESFYIGETEVTQALWVAVMGNNPSHFKGINLPVENVSWNDCLQFINKLNNITGKTFRLPSEAEWEFAARGGNKSEKHKYSGSDYIHEVAWTSSISGSQTHAVKTKAPNEIGIYDMSGNVWEWCYDAYDYYDANNTKETSSSYRICRGGSWNTGEVNCRVSKRYGNKSNSKDNATGFRLVLIP